MSTPNVPEMLPNCSINNTPLKATPKMANCVSIARARADRGSDLSESHKKQRKRDLRTITLRRSFFIEKVTKNDIKREPFGTILVAEAAQARDKPAPRSHHAQDMRKHIVFDGPRCKTRVLEAPEWNSAARARGLLATW